MLAWVQSMYWSVVTITTVGYGDLRPITTEGKALSMVISLGGVLMFALPAGILGSGFVEVMQVHLDEEHEATVRPCRPLAPPCVVAHGRPAGGGCPQSGARPPPPPLLILTRTCSAPARRSCAP
eukprot:COSAG04_NODE_1110_length_8228_cov_3.329315_4_plen_124_part_00